MSLEAMIAALRKEAGGADRPLPVERWAPAYCGAVDIVIDRAGVWRHEGARMTRESLVRLFASVMRKDEDGETYLVTPAEKIRIRVEDAPFLAVRADRYEGAAGPTVAFTTNMGDVVAAGPLNPLRVAIDPATGEPRPYVLVRGRLEARILRAAFYDLAAWAVEENAMMVLESGGARFALGPAA